MEELVKNRDGVQARKGVKKVVRSIGLESQTMARTDDAVESEGLVIENEVLDPYCCD
jgi:hypothetical protein